MLDRDHTRGIESRLASADGPNTLHMRRRRETTRGILDRSADSPHHPQERPRNPC